MRNVQAYSSALRRQPVRRQSRGGWAALAHLTEDSWSQMLWAGPGKHHATPSLFVRGRVTVTACDKALTRSSTRQGGGRGVPKTKSNDARTIPHPGTTLARVLPRITWYSSHQVLEPKESSREDSRWLSDCASWVPKGEQMTGCCTVCWAGSEGTGQGGHFGTWRWPPRRGSSMCL